MQVGAYLFIFAFFQEKIKSLCGMYRFLSKAHKHNFILTLATEYAVEHDKVRNASHTVLEMPGGNPGRRAKAEDNLRNVLSPHYSWLFRRIGRLENGVKFLVDFRTDILVSLDLLFNDCRIVDYIEF